MPADPSENSANTESTIVLPTDLRDGYIVEHGIIVCRGSDDILEVRQPESSKMLYSGLQEIFLHRELVSQTPYIDQPELLPRLRLILEAQTSNQSPGESETEDHQPFDTVLGAVHSRAETYSAFHILNVYLSILFLPWEDDMLIRNQSAKGLVLASIPDEFNLLELGPKEHATIYPGTWELRADDNTSVRFRLRPRQYRLFLEEKSKKRAPRDDTSDVQRLKRRTPQRRDEDGTPRIINPELVPAQNRQVVTRPITTDGAIALARVGLAEDSTVSVVDGVTGRVEYSLTREKARMMKRAKDVDVFKAVFKPGCGVSKPQVVVVKMHKLVGNKELATQYWSREFNIHRGLRHRCIPSLVSFDSRLLALMIEYKAYSDLGSREWRADQVPGKGISFRGTVEDAYTILADISSALAYLASKGIMHNDIRASNILYSGRGVPGGAILIDFGLSRRVDEDPEDRGGGTPWYIAPEYPAYTRESSADIWSLGIVMLYVMRRVPLPETEPIWNMYDEVRGVPKAVAMRQAWNKRIQGQCKELEGPAACAKENKLRVLVRSMVVERELRIRAHALEEATKEWTS